MDLNNLQALAQGCVTEQGPGVFAYRAAYSSRTGIPLDDDCTNARPSSSLPEVQQTLAPTASAALYPTIASSEFTLTYPEGYASVVILNAHGQVVQTQKLNGVKQRVSVVGLAPGVYAANLQATSDANQLEDTTLRFVRQ